MENMPNAMNAIRNIFISTGGPNIDMTKAGIEYNKVNAIAKFNEIITWLMV